MDGHATVDTFGLETVYRERSNGLCGSALDQQRYLLISLQILDIYYAAFHISLLTSRPHLQPYIFNLPYSFKEPMTSAVIFPLRHAHRFISPFWRNNAARSPDEQEIRRVHRYEDQKIRDACSITAVARTQCKDMMRGKERDQRIRDDGSSIRDKNKNRKETPYIAQNVSKNNWCKSCRFTELPLHAHFN